MVNDFGAWVRGLREADGLTQVELAARMNVAQTIVSRVEAGKLEPTERVCVAFARAMDMPTEMVLRRAGYVSDYAVDAVPEDEAVDEFRWRLARVKNPDARALALDTVWSVLESAARAQAAARP